MSKTAVMKMVNINELKNADYNPRRITTAQMDSLKKSLQADYNFFLLRPCLVNTAKGREGVVYAGNMRLYAAKLLGWKEVPCILDDVSLAVEKTRNIKDNQSYGEYVEDQLAERIHELATAKVDMTAFGFSEKELKSLIEDQQLASAPPEDVVKCPTCNQPIRNKPSDKPSDKPETEKESPPFSANTGRKTSDQTYSFISAHSSKTTP